MSKVGDQLTVQTRNGELTMQRTQNGIRLQTPNGQSGEISSGQARQISQALRALASGPGESSQNQQRGGGSSGSQYSGW